MAALGDVARRFDPGRADEPGRAARPAEEPETAVTADQILAIDVGTQSVRALVFDPRGNLVAHARDPDRAVRLAASPAGRSRTPSSTGGRSARPARRLWAGGVARRDAIAGVALTTQRGTVVVTDEAGTTAAAGDRLARPAARRGRPRWAASRASRSGLSASPDGRRVPGRLRGELAPRERARDVARIRHYLLLSGFLTHRLTGRFVDSVAAQVGYLPFDYKRLAWAKAGDWRWTATPVDPALAARARAAGRPAGRAHRRRGGGRRAPGRDRRSSRPPATRRARCWARARLEPHIGSLSLGTTASINTTHRRYVEAIPLVPPYPAAVPGAYSLEVQVYRGYWMVEWFKREFGGGEVARADELGIGARGAVRRARPGDRAGLRWA